MARIGKGLLLILILALVALALPRMIYARPDAVALSNGASLRWSNCWFQVDWLRPVWCGYLRTAPDPGHDGAPFELAVVYIPVPRWRDDGPPLQYIAGGPGGSNWLDGKGVSSWRGWHKALKLNRDLVLYDQRGVGQSRPILNCPELHALRRELLPQLIPTEQVYRRMFDAGRACHERLRAEGHDLARLNTRANARDARDLMRAMGLKQWDVYAVSYGTRIALELMRLQPGVVRAAVLDSIYPPDIHQELYMPWLLERVLHIVTGLCADGVGCRASRQHLSRQLDRALALISSGGVRVKVPDPDDPEKELSAAFMDADLAWALFDALYRWDLIPRIPSAIDAAARGEVNADLRQIYANTVAVLLDPGLSFAVSTSVECHDAGPLSEQRWDAQRRRNRRVAPLTKLDWRYGFCRFWQSGDAGESFRRPVHSTTPSLLLVGEYDPVTPPRWARRAARTLPNSRLLEFPGTGHGVLDSHDCAPALVRAFLRNPEAPDVPNCLDQVFSKSGVGA